MEKRCVTGCVNYYGGEIKHHPNCPYYSDSLSKVFDELKAENKILKERALAKDSTSEKDLRVCEVSKQGLFAEYLSQAMNTFGAKVEVQYVDYSKDTWTSPVRLTESRINQITNDNSVKNIRLSFPF